MEVIVLYRKHIELFQVSGNEYMTLVFENIEEFKNKFLNTAHKNGAAKTTRLPPKQITLLQILLQQTPSKVHPQAQTKTQKFLCCKSPCQ